jgi:hypothetical protein
MMSASEEGALDDRAEDDRMRAHQAGAGQAASEVCEVAGRQLNPCTQLDEYAASAARVDHRHLNLPFLTNKADDTFEFGASVPGNSADLRNWRGTVFVCDLNYAVVGEVLARATARPVLNGTVAEAIELSLSGPVTIVANADLITPRTIARIPPNAQIGLFTVRSVAAASKLAVRTVLGGPAAARFEDLSFTSAGPAAAGPGVLPAEETTPAGLRDAIGSGVAILTGYAHGRDCLVLLGRAGICGRSQSEPLLQVQPPLLHEWSGHPTSCQQGHGCRRDDADISEHVRAVDLRAAFVLLDSCRTAIVGASAVSSDVSIPIAMLEGHAIGVATAAGTRSGATYVGQLFRALLRSGLSLGQAVAEVNGAIAADHEAMGKLVLFGDAGLVAFPSERDPYEAAAQLDGSGEVEIPVGPGATLVAGASVIGVARSGPLIVPRGSLDSSWALTTTAGRGGGPVVEAPASLDVIWAHRVRPWLESLRVLEHMGFSLDDDAVRSAESVASTARRSRAEAATSEAAGAAVEQFQGAIAQLAAVQSGWVADEISWVRATFYDFTEHWTVPWQVISDADPIDCPQCGTDAALVHHVHVEAGAGPEFLYVDCMLCGEVLCGSAAFLPVVVVEHPTEVWRGDPFNITVSITATAERPLEVAVGASFVQGDRFHCYLSAVTSVTLAPAERRSITFAGRTDGVRAIPDLQALKIIVAAEEAHVCLTRAIWLRA